MVPAEKTARKGSNQSIKAAGWPYPESIALRTRPHVYAPFRKQKGQRSAVGLCFLVETRRIELPTFALRTRRSPS